MSAAFADAEQQHCAVVLGVADPSSQTLLDLLSLASEPHWAADERGSLAAFPHSLTNQHDDAPGNESHAAAAATSWSH